MWFSPLWVRAELGTSSAYGWSGGFPRVLLFSPTFDERLTHISEIFLKGPYNPNQKKKKKKKEEKITSSLEILMMAH